MSVMKKTGKVLATITYPIWMPVSVFCKSFKRNTGQGSSVIKQLYKSIKVKPEDEQLTVGLIEAVARGELPEDQILKIPRQRFLFCVVACLLQSVYIIWESATHGDLIPQTVPLSFLLSLAVSAGVYFVSARTQLFINALNAAFHQSKSDKERAIYKIALWYRFFLSKKRTFQFGSLSFISLSIYSFSVGSFIWALIPLLAAFCFFGPNIFSVQHRLWQLRSRRLSVDEKGGISDFMRESHWLIGCMSPEFFSEYTGELINAA